MASAHNARLVNSIDKLAVAAEHAGLSVEQMIQLLNGGLAVKTLLELITWRLTELASPISAPCCSARWVAEPVIHEIFLVPRDIETIVQGAIIYSEFCRN